MDNNSSRHIVFYELNRRISGVEYLKAAKELGLFVTLVSVNPKHYLNMEEKLYGSIFAYINNVITVKDTHNNLEDVIQKLKLYDHIYKIDGLFGSFDLEIEAVSHIAEDLGLPGLHPETSKICCNKFLMRQAFLDKDISSIKFELINDYKDACIAGEKIGYPCVLKQVDGQGSESVRLISTPEEFIEPLKWHKENPIYWRGVKKNPQMLVEEYMRGKVYSVESVAYNGQIYILGIFDRELSPLPYFAELSGCLLTDNFPGRKEIVKMARDTLQKIGYTIGPAHTEFILTKEGPKIIEINPRIAGSSLSKIMSECLGYNVHKEILKLFVGESAKFTNNAEGTGMVKAILPQKTGIIKEIDGVEEVQNTPGIIEVTLFKKIGDNVSSQITNNTSIIAEITAVGKDLNHLSSTVDIAISKLKVSIA